MSEPDRTKRSVAQAGSGFELPHDLTSFEGRRSDLQRVKQLLADTRLLTLTGFGGVGKTRLALRAARDLVRTQADGVAWIELADLPDPALLKQTVVEALDLPELPVRGMWPAALRHLSQRQMLIVLDNCEHVLSDVAEMVADLLRCCPGLHVLTTSRQILGVPGETVLAVAPLPVPPPERAAEPGAATLFPSLALFRERAAAAVPGFELTPANQQVAADLCRKLEGIPLAIELAAVKLRVLSLEDLVERVDARLGVLAHSARTGPSRHRTIEATIDWSYDLCTEDERTLWARASVFVGGFGVAAAEDVCAGTSLPRETVLEVIQGLVEKSVLLRTDHQGQVRFRMLEPIREHGQARLRALGEYDEVIHRHLAWIEALLSEACLQWFGPTQEIWCTTLRSEQPNIRAAAEHCLAHAECRPRSLTLIGTPWFLWIALFLDEGRQWLERAVAAALAPSLPLATALSTLSYVASLQGDLERADECAAAAHAMAVELGDERVQAYATHMSGLSALFQDPQRSKRLLQDALTVYEGHDVLDDLVVGLRVQLALACLFCGDLEESRSHFDWCRDLCRLTGERWLLSYALYGLGFVEKLEGCPDQALVLAREALNIKWFFRDMCGLSATMDLIAWAHADAERYQEAACLLGAADTLWRSFGLRLFGSAHWLENMQIAEARSRSVVGDRVFEAAYQSGRALEREEAIALATGKKSAPTPAHLADLSRVTLTKREGQIAELIAEGLSNRSIAERLVISQRTVEGHVDRTLAKLNFHSRAQVAAWIGERRSSQR